MTHIKPHVAATVTAALLLAASCSSAPSASSALSGQLPPPTTASASGLRSPDYASFQPRKEGDTDEPRRDPVPVNTDVLLGLPWRAAQKMAHDAGWETQMSFTGEDGSVIMTEELVFTRLRIVVDGGEEAGTVVAVYHG